MGGVPFQGVGAGDGVEVGFDGGDSGRRDLGESRPFLEAQAEAAVGVLAGACRSGGVFVREVTEGMGIGVLADGAQGTQGNMASAPSKQDAQAAFPEKSPLGSHDAFLSIIV